jgi:hypothetical protein
MKHKNVAKGKKKQPDQHSAPEAKPPEATRSSQEHAVRDHENTQAKNEPTKPLRFWNSPNHVIAVFTVVIAIANGFYAWFLWKQVDVTYLDQRAWVGITDAIEAPLKDAEKTVYVKEGSEILYGVIMANTGKTPAVKIQTRVSMKAYRPGEQFKPVYDRASPEPSLTVLQPGGRVLLDVGPSDQIPTADLVDQLKTRTIVLYFYGTISYEDVFRNAHHTTFCYFLRPNLTTTSPCGTYNEVD